MQKIISRPISKKYEEGWDRVFKRKKVEDFISYPWVGCQECDPEFPCYDGKAKCMRLPLDKEENP